MVGHHKVRMDVEKGARGERGNSPINITTVLAPPWEVRMKLNTGKDALLALHGADKAHGAVHVARDIHLIANREVVGRRPARSGWSHISGICARARFRTVVDYGLICVGAAGIGNAGQGG